MPIPILIFSDAAASKSGLSRITRDLATRIATEHPDVFRVATIGNGHSGSRHLPFQQYAWSINPDWIIHDLEDVWQDFAGDEKGILFTIQDAARVLWLADPKRFAPERLKKFLEDPPFQKWGYFPMDADNPGHKLTHLAAVAMKGYDRVLAYSQWAKGIIDCSDIGKTVEALPHGLDTSIFRPLPKPIARAWFSAKFGMAIPEDVLLLGIVASNQSRKDFGLGFAVAAELAKTRKILLWIHTDALERSWSLPALTIDFGLTGKVIATTGGWSDADMAVAYAACDVTLAIALGEGFGFALAESIACGTPCVHGDYAGGAEFIEKEFLVQPVGYRIEGPWNAVRPVFDPEDWTKCVLQAVGKTPFLPEYLKWENAWKAWESWLRKGVGL